MTLKIYTRTGDRGETGLFGGGRVAKDHVRVDAYGDVDELNSLLGVAIAQLPGGDPIAGELRQVQADLLELRSQCLELCSQETALIGGDRFRGIDQRFEHHRDARQDRFLDPVERFFEAGLLIGLGHRAKLTEVG